jgi:Bacteriophage probable baseplate hub protein
MELTAFARTYGDFYAPAYTVRVGGRDLVRDVLAAVSQVEVELKLRAASRFSFTIVDAYDHEYQFFRTGSGGDLLGLLAFGADVEVCMGYGDAKSTPRVVQGIVTEIGLSFPEGGSPELSVAGFDHGHRLVDGKNSRTWKDRRDSEVARELASFHNLGDAIEETKEKHPQIEQNQEGDWDFLEKLAKRNHFQLYVDEARQLHFHPPNDDASAAIELAYGKGLLSFKPEANIARQVSRVEVYGWDPRRKKAFVGKASAGEESGLTGKSAGQHLDAYVRDPDKRPTLRVRQPCFSQSEADARAEAALNERAKEFLTGEGEVIGLPDVRPDRRIKLTELGSFSKTYYVQEAVHKIDANGYRTRFKVKEPGL